MHNICDSILNSIQDESFDVANDLCDRLRFTRSAYKSNVDENLKYIYKNRSLLFETPEFISKLKFLNIKIDSIERWFVNCASEFSIEELLQSDFGINLYLNASLPWVWDFNKDIVVFIGNPNDNLLKQLFKRGQRNILVFTDEIPKFSNNKGLLYHTLSNVDYESLQLDFLSFNSEFVICNIECSNDDAVIAELKKYIDLKFFQKRTEYKLTNNNYPQFIEGLCNIKNIYPINSVSCSNRDHLIISPGPSLKNDIAYLKKHYKKFLTIAPLRSLEFLLEHGIYPDFAVWVDYSDSVHLFSNLKDISQINLILMDTCHRDFFMLPFKKVFVFPDVLTIGLDVQKTIYGDNVPFIGGASVSNSCASIANYLGARSITLIGQDLCLSERPYANEKFSSNYEGQKINNNLLVESLSGELVESPPDYYNYKVMFEEFAEHFKESIALINSTSKGALINGWDCVPLEKHFVIQKESVKNKNFAVHDGFDIDLEKIIFYLEDIFIHGSVILLYLNNISKDLEYKEINHPSIILMENELREELRSCSFFTVFLSLRFEEFAQQIKLVDDIQSYVYVTKRFYEMTSSSVNSILEKVEATKTALQVES